MLKKKQNQKGQSREQFVCEKQCLITFSCMFNDNYFFLFQVSYFVKSNAEFQKVRILGSRIPDIIVEKSRHFWLRPEILSIYRYSIYFLVENET